MAARGHETRWDSAAAAAAPLRAPDLAQLTGRDSGHVVPLPESLGGGRLHPALMRPLGALRQAALDAGFDLRVASGFRDYQRQLRIWNDKAAGRRPLLDRDEAVLQADRLAPEQLLHAILHWSALPACSRHHWGTDLDVYDTTALGADGRPALTVAECRDGGPMQAFHLWLDQRLERGDAFGFFRPYSGDGNGVAAEPWHLSWAPLAVLCQQALPPEVLLPEVLDEALALKEVVAAQFVDIYRRYVYVDRRRYPPAQAERLAAAGV